MSFTDYAGSGFLPYILPIIPKGAPLSPHSKLTPDRIGKIPGLRYPEGWGGFPKHAPWQKHVSTAKFLNGLDELYLKDRLVPTIGLQLGMLVAVDGDFDNPELARVVEDCAFDMLGNAPVRFRPNSAKSLLLYRLKEGSRPVLKQRAAYRTMFGEQGATEILGKGQQCLIEGMHPSGVHYEWVMGMTPLVMGFDGLTEVTADQVDAFMARIGEAFAALGMTRIKGGGNARLSGVFNDSAAHEVGPGHPELCPDLDMLKDLLTHIPCTLPEFATYDEWANACVAIVTACGKDEGFWPSFLEWCSAVPENLADGEDYIRGKWESVNESKIGWGYLCHIAHDYGYTGDAQRAFDELPTGGKGQPSAAGPTPRLDGSYEAVIADAFVAQHAGKDWLFAPLKKGGDWLRFGNGVWHEDTTVLHDISLECREVGRRIRSNSQATPAQLLVAKSMNTAHTAQAVRTLVQNNPAIVVPYEQLDNRPLILGVPGGYIDEEGRLRDPDPSLLLTTQTAVAPDFSARCPHFDALLMHLANKDPEIHDFIWALLGYTLTGLCSEQIFVFLLGTQGGEGETTLTSTLQLVLGDYATPIRNTMFVRGRNEDTRFATSALKGKRFAYANELELGQKWAGERLKEISGGGEIIVERKFGGMERMLVQSTVWFMGNSLPYFPPSDSALQRRMALIEAHTPIAEKDNQRGFAEHLAKTEGQAILARMIEASQRYVKNGKLLIPESVRQAVDERFEEDDQNMDFVEDSCELDPDLTASSAALFQTYTHWALTAGVQEPLRSSRSLVRMLADHPRLKKLGHKIVRIRHVDSSDASSPRGLRGIGIRGQVTRLTALSR